MRRVDSDVPVAVGVHQLLRPRQADRAVASGTLAALELGGIAADVDEGDVVPVEDVEQVVAAMAALSGPKAFDRLRARRASS